MWARRLRSMASLYQLQFAFRLCIPIAFFFFTFGYSTDPQRCYFGPGSANRGPPELVPCVDDGQSACCLLGDTCLSGNACYNNDIGSVYQYGCTDRDYQDESCPPKCDFSPDLSPWTALELCDDLGGVNNTWVCHAPESCGCDWGSPTENIISLAPRGCSAMGSQARVALYAPTQLAPYVSLPSSLGGSTGYYSPTTVNGTETWIQTSVSGYTPMTISQLTTYERAPTIPVVLRPGATPASDTASAPERNSAITQTSYPAATQSVPLSPSSTSTIGAQPLAATSTQGSGSSKSLSTSSKVGIGVGIAGGVLFLIAVGILLWIWHRRHFQRRSTKSSQTAVGSAGTNQALQGVASPLSSEKHTSLHQLWQSTPRSDSGTLASSPPYGPLMPYYGTQNQFGPGSYYDEPSQVQQRPEYRLPSVIPAELESHRRVHEVGSDGNLERQATLGVRKQSGDSEE